MICVFGLGRYRYSYIYLERERGRKRDSAGKDLAEVLPALDAAVAVLRNLKI